MSEYLFPFKLFVRVAHAGSFSRAGRELGISQSSVSRIVAALEQDLGAMLLTRTTREVALTEAGANYLASIEPILAAFEEANLGTRGSSELHGVLRVGLSSGIAIRKIMPKLPEFMARFPLLHVELVADQTYQDASKDRLDVVLDMGSLDVAAATIRLISTSPRVLVASPDYLARCGTPKVPVDLMRHSIVSCPSVTGACPWFFSQRGRSVSVKLDGCMTTNVNEVAIAAAVNGVGVVSVGRWDCQKELEANTLVRVLENWQMEDVKMCAFFPAGTASKPAARIFVDYLIQVFHSDPGPVLNDEEGEREGNSR